MVTPTMPDAALGDVDRATVGDLAPVLERAVRLDPGALVRLRFGDGRATALVRLPFAVLVSRSVAAGPDRALDVATAAADVLAWLDGGAAPAPRDHDWRGGLPPATGWRRIETVPDGELRPLVRQGAMALKDAAEREGVPGAQPRAEVADALLDSVVLIATDDSGSRAEVTLRMLSALTRMGFLRKDGHAHVDTSGRWVRVVGEYGTVHRELPGGLGLL